MSKPVKDLIKQELVKKFEGVDSMAVVSFTGIDAISTNNIRARLRAKNIRMTVVKNSIARSAFSAAGLDMAKEMLEGPCAVVYGKDSVVGIVRELLAIGRDAPNLKVKAALLEGDIFGADRIEALSKFPTREEAIARTVSVVLSPGKKLAGCIIGPGSKIASLIKAIEEKKKTEAPAAEAAPAEAVAAPAAPAAAPAAPEAPAAPAAPQA